LPTATWQSVTAICSSFTGGSRLDLAAIGLDDEQLFQRNSVQIIALDRPGYGSSSDLPGRKLLDYAADVVEIANKLKIDKFNIIGVSGGGIYALACSYKLPKIAPGRLRSFIHCLALLNPCSVSDIPTQ
jgi:pimeloyl-ACP methyl ester carboxylesterase